ncbi:MAG: hypothetical protein AAF456_13220 [Planctomycetota bacterium]
MHSRPEVQTSRVAAYDYSSLRLQQPTTTFGTGPKVLSGWLGRFMAGWTIGSACWTLRIAARFVLIRVLEIQ